jgi:ribosomal protein S16
MLKIRFSPTGRKRSPQRRIVVTEHTNPVKSGEVEILGWYDPVSKKCDIKMDRVNLRVSQGAQLSPSVAKLIKTQNLTLAA